MYSVDSEQKQRWLTLMFFESKVISAKILWEFNSGFFRSKVLLGIFQRQRIVGLLVFLNSLLLCNMEGKSSTQRERFFYPMFAIE